MPIIGIIQTVLQYQRHNHNPGIQSNFTGTYNIYLNVTDNLNYRVQSNAVTLNIYSQPTVTINPVLVSMTVGNTQQFTSNVAGGLIPYTYQWYINNTAVTGARNPNWTFTPTANGNYQIYLSVSDSLGEHAQSNIANVNVSSVTLC